MDENVQCNEDNNHYKILIIIKSFDQLAQSLRGEVYLWDESEKY
jgi:hypothetical protein